MKIEINEKNIANELSLAIEHSFNNFDFSDLFYDKLDKIISNDTEIEQLLKELLKKKLKEMLNE